MKKLIVYLCLGSMLCLSSSCINSNMLAIEGDEVFITFGVL